MLGNPINTVINIEKETFLFTSKILFFAKSALTAGTKAVANAILNESGKFISVSTFPLKIPY